MSTTYNYMTDGGKTWVIGGKLKVLPGAKVEGLEGGSGAVQLENVSDSAATTVAALRADYNELLRVLRAAGLMKEEA